MSSDPLDPSPIYLREHPAEMEYCAFLDVLGFATKILGDFDQTLDQYEELIKMWKWHYKYHSDVSLTVYSDSLLLRSKYFPRMVQAVNTLATVTAMNDCLLRGGVAFGKHVEVRDGHNIYVLSEALTHAAQLEKIVRHPCVAIHKSVEIPLDCWHPGLPNLHRPVLFFDGITLVNPFNIMWYTSAATRVAQLAVKYPEYSEKYDWYQRLHLAVSGDVPLIPGR